MRVGVCVCLLIIVAYTGSSSTAGAMRADVIRLFSFPRELFLLSVVVAPGTGGAVRIICCRFWLVLPPEIGRELTAGGVFGKARLDENSPLCWAFVLRAVELSGRLTVAGLFGLFVLLRTVTLLNNDTARL